MKTREQIEIDYEYEKRRADSLQQDLDACDDYISDLELNYQNQIMSLRAEIALIKKAKMH